MHDAMSDCGEPAASCVPVGPVQDIVQNVFLLPGCRPAAIEDAFALHVLDREVRLAAGNRDLACEQIRGAGTGQVEQSELDAGGSGVQGKHYFRHGRHLIRRILGKQQGCYPGGLSARLSRRDGEHNGGENTPWKIL
jgi:hypothetical protein